MSNVKEVIDVLCDELDWLRNCTDYFLGVNISAVHKLYS